ncbi:MAG TPA: proton-conducting transporter membrane subunit, partial [Mariprofundaceae bacterium]|nr:proton-conducting transporter membrane subunit [Mariprofundaceae bacterium]
DLKRLLAYSSVENVGIILIGFGLSLLLAYFGHPQLAALGLIAALYHAINHSLFKGLLFMGAGAVLHATGSRNLEAMGGLIRRLPVTAVLVLAGCIAISALPPFNGFVSEWLTFQTALLTPKLGGSLLTAIVPFSAAMLALAAALAAAAFVKVFGIAFLGTPRSEAAANAHEVDRWMQAGMAIPAVLCLLLGLLPVLVVPLIDHVPQLLLNVSIAASVDAGGWLWLTPVDATRASYSAPIVLFGMLLLGGIAYWLLHPRGGAVRRSPLWSCGHPTLAPTMQYTATGFAQPIRRIFAGLYRPVEHLHAEGRRHKLVAGHIRYALHVADLAAEKLYKPLGDGALELARLVNKQHKYGLHAYLAYIFVTVLVLLAVVI